MTGRAQEAVGDAPGRVNLLGEHTDYNEGYVLPAAIPQRTRVRVRRSSGDAYTLHSANLGRSARFALDAPPADAFARYVYGCLRVLRDDGIDLPPLDLAIDSDVPIGAGLSSSAALEVATLRAVRKLLDLAIDDVRLAHLAHAAEVEHAGVRCGILDPMACSLLAPGAMLFLDTRTLARELLRLPHDAELLVVDSGVARTLAGSRYNERRAECEDAARRLGVRALRDVEDVAALSGLPDLLRRRARHVVTENARALRAARTTDAAAFGELMSQSHASLRDDYEVSMSALDAIVDALRAQDGVHGAKLTGAGFGGACVALCRVGRAAGIGERVCAGQPGRRVLVPAR